MLKCDDRFARHNRDGPPPEFPLASPSSSIVHHLSGPIGRAPTRTARKRGLSTMHHPARGGFRLVHFHCASCSRPSRGLARTLDSLVRVSVFQDGSDAAPVARRSRVGLRNRSAALLPVGEEWRTRSSPQRPAPTSRTETGPCAPRSELGGRGDASLDVRPGRRLGRRSSLVRSGIGGAHGLGSARFHALLNSLFKVLFILPSRYLFAIGLAPVFVEPWMESTTRFGLQSQTTRLSDSDPSGGGRRVAHGVVTLSDAPFQETWTRQFGRPPHRAASSVYKSQDGRAISTVGHFPLHSPSLRESWLVFRPPLSDMLKFGGSSWPSRGPNHDVFRLDDRVVSAFDAARWPADRKDLESRLSNSPVVSSLSR